MKMLLTVAMLLAAGLAVAQNPAPAAPNADKKSEAQTLSADRLKYRNELKDLQTKEKAEIAAVKADASKSAADQKAAIKAILADYNTKKTAAREALKAAHPELRKAKSPGGTK